MGKVLELSEETYQQLADLAQRQQRTVEEMLRLIALARGLMVVTRNTRDFGQVPGLQIEDWTVEGRLP